MKLYPKNAARNDDMWPYISSLTDDITFPSIEPKENLLLIRTDTKSWFPWNFELQKGRISLMQRAHPFDGWCMVHYGKPKYKEMLVSKSPWTIFHKKKLLILLHFTLCKYHNCG